MAWAFSSSWAAWAKARALHIGAGTCLIPPQRQQLAHLRHRKAQGSRPPQEAQRLHIAIRIAPVAGRTPPSRRNKANAFIVSEHLGRDAGRRRCLANVHAGWPNAGPGLCAAFRTPAPQQDRAAHHPNAGERHGGAGDHRAEQAGRRQRNADQVIGKRSRTGPAKCADRSGQRYPAPPAPRQGRRASA